MAHILTPFVLSLKTQENIQQLEIDPSDTPDSLFQKWLKINPKCCLFQYEVIEKIKAKLREIRNNENLQQVLKNSVDHFINSFCSKEDDQQSNQLSSIQINSKVQSCYSELVLEDQFRLPKQQGTQTEPQQQKILQQSSLINIENKNIKLTKNIKNQSAKPQKSKLLIVQKKQVKRTKKCNPDLIKACENILKKCPLKEMKMMAKQFMKQYGYYKEKEVIQQKQNRRIVFMTEQSTNPTNPNIENKNSLSQSLLCPRNRNSSQLRKDSSVSLKRDTTKRSICANKYKYLDNSLKELKSNYHVEKSHEKVEQRKIHKKYNYLDC